MNLKFTPKALSNPRCLVHEQQHTNENHFHWTSTGFYRTPHIPVARCNPSRFPDAKLIKLTSANDVLPALATIYTNYGNPKVHKADNGPPFNSKEFRDFSTARGIHIKHSYPYHPQGNEAKCFIKRLGKAVKIAIDTNRPLQKAIGDLLSDYRSTPHPATGVAPGNMLFHGGYNSIFPRTPGATKQVIEEARLQDTKRKQDANERINMCHRGVNIPKSFKATKSWHCG